MCRDLEAFSGFEIGLWSWRGRVRVREGKELKVKVVNDENFGGGFWQLAGFGLIQQCMLPTLECGSSL